ncbi:MAG: hypothetical protein E6H07_15980 [Bacteroidetes bacterium]|nr:MAG: hypothetical protein E6H07_15980 [Bacteroidota bacterium]
MKNTKRLKLTLGQTFNHYGIVIFFLFLVVLLFKDLIEIYLNSYTGVRSTNELINSLWPFLALAIFFAIVQYRRLRFKEYKANFTEEEFQEAIKRTVTDLELRIDSNSENFFKAYRGSWEVIIIIKDKDRLLVNSICDPKNFSSFTSFGVNRKNISTFIKNLTDVLNNKPAEIKIENQINEWSIKRIIFRLFVYPFCIFLIVFGVYLVLQPLTAKSIAAGLGAIMVAGIYLYSDIKILSAKKENG